MSRIKKLDLDDWDKDLREMTAADSGTPLEQGAMRMFAHPPEISKGLTNVLHESFNKLGFNLIDFRIEGTEFDEDTLVRINKIADVSADVHAATTAGVSYRELQQLKALGDAAKNESGAAGMFIGMGAGNVLASTMNEPFTQSTENSKDLGTRLRELKSFHKEGLISDEEYSLKKSAILQEL